MKPLFCLAVLYCLVSATGCNQKPASSDQKVTASLPDTTTTVTPLPAQPVTAVAADTSSHSSLKVAAFLVYKDGSLSSFDVLNDKTKALWNVVIGEGDAEKPSEQVKILLAGSADSLDIVIKQHKKKVLDKTMLAFRDSVSFIIDNTGCNEIFVTVSKQKAIQYKGTIEFHCGE